MQVEQVHSSVLHTDAQLPPALWEKVPRMSSLAFLPSSIFILFPFRLKRILLHGQVALLPFSQFSFPCPISNGFDTSIFWMPFSEAPLCAQGSQPRSFRFLPLFFVVFAFTLWFPYSKGTSARRRHKLCRFYEPYVSVTTTSCCDKLKATATCK